MERVSKSGLSFYRNQAWQGVRHGIFTRQGGASKSHWSSLNLGASIGDDPAAVVENHRRIYDAVEVNPRSAVSSWLVHSVETLVINGNTSSNGQLKKADAIITDQADRPLVMRYADCVPLLLYDPVRRAIGLGHAGWRGTVKGMAGKMVREMRFAFGCLPEDIQAVIGPAISRRNYRVGADVVAEADAYFGEDAGVVARDPAGGTQTFDLWRANQLDLSRHGVTEVEVLDICTYENTDEFYSHRAEEGMTGRFGVVISL
ncbi:MAG: peptidoglycan editing factor PgeF [Chloroflexi bacterium]|nr:peptidoglycan editing factor PgeF [Chloroflexota bacterium]